MLHKAMSPHKSLNETGEKEPGLPESLNCELSDDRSGLELTTEAEQEPLSNPSIENGTAAADCSWCPLASS